MTNDETPMARYGDVGTGKLIDLLWADLLAAEADRDRAVRAMRDAEAKVRADLG